MKNRKMSYVGHIMRKTSGPHDTLRAIEGRREGSDCSSAVHLRAT